MVVNIKRIDRELPLPAYETAGAAGFDFLAREEKTINPQQIMLIPGNVIVETPSNYMLAVVSRSSTPKKRGLMLPHGLGIIDSDYRGPDDEIWIQVYNFTDKPVVVHRGDKIAQGIFIPVVQAAWREVDEVNSPTRGGRGSTGGYKGTSSENSNS
jgi:dUTP pyrophosphatase